LSSSRILFFLLIAALASTGCLGKNKIVKRTVQDLYQEALQSAARRPEAVRPAVPEYGVEQFDAAGNRVPSLSCDGIPIEMLEPSPPLESNVLVGSSISSSVKTESGVPRVPPATKKELVKNELTRKDSSVFKDSSDFIDRDALEATDEEPLPLLERDKQELDSEDENLIEDQDPPVVSTVSTLKHRQLLSKATAGARKASSKLDPQNSKATSRSKPKKPEVVHASFRDTGRIVVVSAPGELQDPLTDSDTMDELGITESFDQTDIREALNIIAAQAKKSVVIDDTIGGVVSAEIINMEFESALKSLLQPLALYYAKDGDRYIIAPADPDSPLYTYIAKRSLYAPKFQDTASLTTMLPTRYKKYYQISPERNLIVIDAPNRIAEEIEERLLELDKPIPQVELEAIVCVVAPDSSFRFGLDWGHRVGGAESEDLNVSMNNLGLKSAFSADGARNIFSDFAVTSAFVRLLAQEGYITIRAAPRVTAKDGEKANISINRETFFSLQPNNSSVFFQQSIQKVEAGISLEITPRVHDDMVSVKIGKAEVSEDIRTQAANADLSSVVYPIINRRTVSTEVMVRDGHTIVIGGLVQRQTVDRIAQVPFFSSIPIAGKLFESIEKQEQDAEVAIFICPRIVPVSSLCPEFTP
jgi:type II secretory pathway component GspD/PulD (secretin)